MELSRRNTDQLGEKMARPLLSSDVYSHLHHQLIQHIPSVLPDRSGIWCRTSIARHSNSFVPSRRWNIPDPRRDRFCSLGSKEHLPARNASSLTFRNRRGVITQLSRLDRIPIPTRGRSRTLFCTCYRHSNTPLQNRGRGPGARLYNSCFNIGGGLGLFVWVIVIDAFNWHVGLIIGGV